MSKIFDKNEIADTEILCRGVQNKPSHVREDGSFTSAVFKDPGGASVNRDGDREINGVIDRMKIQYDFVCSVSYTDCLNCGTYPIAKPSRKNRYHAEIHESSSITEISQRKLRKLVEIGTKH